MKKKYKITENQHKVITGVNRYKAVKELNEMEFIAQQTRVLEEENEGRNNYTVQLTVLGSLDIFTNDELDNLSADEYYNYIISDVKNKLQKAFRTKEFSIQNISTQARGDITK